MNDAPAFDITNPDLLNGLVVEASAGTGKTFSVAALVARELALDDTLRMNNILVTTFTRNAAAELRDRIRRRVASLERQLRAGEPETGDDLASALMSSSDNMVRADRLARALREFDQSTISTIHSVCSRILAIAGLDMGNAGAEVDIDVVLAEVVNDILIEEKTHGHAWKKEGSLRDVVKEYLRSPRSVLDYRRTDAKSGAAIADDDPRMVKMARLRCVVERAVKEIRTRTEHEPTFDDLLLRTATLLADPAYITVVESFRERFRLAVIDEAQDTDALQWEIFRSLFGADETERMLMSVGDPKQAIYRFRGADVEAYLAARDPQKVRTLRRNFRSDAGLIDALNHVFGGRSFGPGIDYVNVSARDEAPESAVRHTKPLTVIDLGVATVKYAVATPTALRVREILEKVQIRDGDAFRLVEPGDICVLVSNRHVGRAIESNLRSMGVAAVSAGTESVMVGSMAISFRRLFEAMDTPHLERAIRLVAATPFFGDSLADAGVLDDVRLEQVRSTVAGWSSTLRRKGVAALASAVRGDRAVLERIVRGEEGERRETDFAHVVELLHSETNGVGCAPAHVLDAFDVLAARNELSDTVSRRVESDREAVQIMTVHASKGLEFPIVVVADLWKLDKRRDGAATFYRPSSTGGTERVIDIGLVEDFEMDTGARKSEERADRMRVFYVAMTRARHHVSLLVSRGEDESKDLRATNDVLARATAKDARAVIEVVSADKLPRLDKYQVPRGTTLALTTAPGPTNGVAQSYRRLSFTGITGAVKGRQVDAGDVLDPPQGGRGDDAEPILVARTRSAGPDVPFGVESMPMARLTGGTYFGKVMHSVYEHIDFASPQLEADVTAAVARHVTGYSLRAERDAIVQGVVSSLRTPLGGPFGASCLVDVSLDRRLAELNFEMSLAGVADANTVSAIGRLLEEMLPADDELTPYAASLSTSIFDVPLVGLMNGSIDALINMGDTANPRLFITDYKSNRLDEDGDATLIDGYSRARLITAMRHHHYPLQALIYGASVHRYLRWRRPDIDADSAIGGIAYFFIRGMVGANTPEVDGHRHGVFTWTAPRGLWARLSDLFAGVRI